MLTNISSLKTLRIVTIIVVIASTYVAAELILAEDEDGGRHIVDTSRCNEQRYYELNEAECDGFIMWLVPCGPPVAIISIIWLLVWTLPKIRKYP